MAPPERFMAANAFFEHLGLVGGFLLVAWHDLRAQERARMCRTEISIRARASHPQPLPAAWQLSRRCASRCSRVLWAATVLGNIGSFMRDVASAWMVTDLSASPTAVALIQTAATLPIFLLAIPAGVLSDILDRRRFLIFIQVVLAARQRHAAGAGAAPSALTVEYLIALTFVGGIGAALMGPTWQSIVPELVPRSDLQERGGAELAGHQHRTRHRPGRGRPAAGELRRGRRLRRRRAELCVRDRGAAVVEAPGDGRQRACRSSFFGAFRAGLRYARASQRAARGAAARGGVLPVRQFGLGAAAAGGAPDAGRHRRLLWRAAGRRGRGRHRRRAGAAAPARQARRRRPGAAGLAARRGRDGGAGRSRRRKWLAVLLLLLLGLGWIIALTTLNGVAQAILPNWVRGRGLAIYLTVFNGAMAAGSLGWGLVAQEIGVPATLLVGAAGLVVVALVFHRVAPAGRARPTCRHRTTGPSRCSPSRWRTTAGR